MERLSVYEDYTQTMDLLRASWNRVKNTLRTGRYDPAHAKKCADMCLEIHRRHIEAGLVVLKHLHATMAARSVDAAIQAASALHRHNRKSARLTRLFELDVANEHMNPNALWRPTPDGGEIALPPPPRNPDAAIPIDKFRDALSKELNIRSGRSTPAPR